MQELQTALAWQQAIALSQQLVRLIEEFSDADTNVIVWHLRQAVVEVPSTIAADLQANREATMEPVGKLATELELIRRIYPAIDSSDVEEALEALVLRMQSGSFAERETEAEIEQETEEAAEDEAVAESAPEPEETPPPVPVDAVSAKISVKER